MNKSNSLITIAIPAYKSRYLKLAIDSVLCQTYTNIELLIVNDKSPENINQIVSCYHDDRICYIENESNLGASDPAINWDKCLSLASGEFFCILCDDDIYKPTFVEEMLKLALRFPECNVFRARCGTIDNFGKIRSLYPSSPLWESSEDYMYHVFQGLRRQTISEWFYRTSQLKNDGGFVHFPLAWHADYFSIFKNSMKGGIASSYLPLVFFRMSGDNISSKFTENGAEKAKANLMAYQLGCNLVSSSSADFKPMLSKTIDAWKYVQDSDLIHDMPLYEKLRLIMNRKKYEISNKAILKGFFQSVFSLL